MARTREFITAPMEDTGEVTTILAQGASLTGNLNVPGGIRIDGNMKGEIESTGTVIIGKEGQVEGKINANNGIIGGNYKGNLLIRERLVIESTSVVNGDIKAKRLGIEEGAIFEGTVTMKEKPVPE